VEAEAMVTAEARAMAAAMAAANATATAATTAVAKAMATASDSCVEGIRVVDAAAGAMTNDRVNNGDESCSKARATVIAAANAIAMAAGMDVGRCTLVVRQC